MVFFIILFRFSDTIMNRKKFITSLLTVGAVSATMPLLADTNASVKSKAKRRTKVPPYLIEGDTIGITSPAGYISLDAIAPSVELMESWGFKVKIGECVGKREYTYGGTDKERRDDLQRMLDDREVKAVMCARGGYGLVRIVDQLDFTRFERAPKWLIGFSDVTVLHGHINRSCGIATIHSKMCNSFPADWSSATPVQISTILSIKDALTGKKMEYKAPRALSNRLGAAEGILVGGNLSIIETLAGTASDMNAYGKLLFLEDTGEDLYRLDRMFWNLKRTGKLANLAGLIVGGFKLKAEEPGAEFGKSIYEIVMEKVEDYNYPICFDFPVGHQVNNFALRCGMKHRLEVRMEGSELKSI